MTIEDQEFGDLGHDDIFINKFLSQKN